MKRRMATLSFRWMCGRNRHHEVEYRNVMDMELVQARNALVKNSIMTRVLPTRW